MPTLHELQSVFAAALLDETIEPALALIARGEHGPNAGIDVYRNNVRIGFAKVLALEFPVINRLVGEDYFQQLAWEFQRAHPSRSGDLHNIGGPFPGYLDIRFAASQYGYLGDVARIEWARECISIMADDSVLSIAALQDVEPERYADLRLERRRDSELLASDFPVATIWQSNQPDSPADQTIDLGAGGENVLVLRTSGGIELLPLSNAEIALLRTLDAGAPLGTAFDLAFAQDQSLDLGAVLQRLFRHGVFRHADITDTTEPLT